MDRAKKILVNILTGLMIAVVAGIASNGAKGEHSDSAEQILMSDHASWEHAQSAAQVFSATKNATN